jgi:hypothetical protein
VKIWIIVLCHFDAWEVEGVYASAEAADRAETRYNRKHPFSKLAPEIHGPYVLRGRKRAAS